MIPLVSTVAELEKLRAVAEKIIAEVAAEEALLSSISRSAP